MSLFENLVHNGANLTDIEKFSNLISRLPDEALANKSNNSAVASEQIPLKRASFNHSTSNDSVILTAAVVQFRTNGGYYILARALLDSGSQPNFITEDLAQRLRITKEKGPSNLTGIGETTSNWKFSRNVELAYCISLKPN